MQSSFRDEEHKAWEKLYSYISQTRFQVFITEI